MKVTAQKVIECGSEGELIWRCLDVWVEQAGWKPQ